MLTKEQVRQHLCEVITAILSENGSSPVLLSDDVRPTGDLGDFDSLCAVDAEVRLSNALGFEIENIPFKQDRGKDQTLREIVDGLCQKYSDKVQQ